MFAAWCDNQLSGKLCVKSRSSCEQNQQVGQNALQISAATETTFYYRPENYGDPYGKSVIMSLLAAGESILETQVDRISFSGYFSGTHDVPKYLQDFKKVQLSLKWACREAIKKKLIQLDPHTNLFIRVPKLGLPKILQSYLLHDMSVESREIN